MRIIDESSAQTPVDRTRTLRCLQATCAVLVVTHIVMAATIGSAINNIVSNLAAYYIPKTIPIQFMLE